MAFTNAQQARVAIGLLNASAYTRSLGGTATNDVIDVTTIVDTAKKFIVGQSSATFTIAGPLDTDPTANNQFDALNDQLAGNVDVPITFGMNGFALGSTVWMYNAIETQLQYQSQNDQSTNWSVNAQVDSLFDFNGVSISDFAAITTNTNGTSVDNGAATSNGGVAHLHVSAYSGLTSDSVIIEHSTDNSAWVTLDTFTSVTGQTSERRTIAAGTTVRRYMRVRDAVTGTGSCTRAVFFARR